MYEADNFPGPKYNFHQETMHENTYHLPIIARTDDTAFSRYIGKIQQKLESFNPEVLVVSAGFDMNYHDTESNLMPSKISLTKNSYGQLANICNRYPSLAILEGGYSPHSIKEGLEAFGLE